MIKRLQIEEIDYSTMDASRLLRERVPVVIRGVPAENIDYLKVLRERHGSEQVIVSGRLKNLMGQLAEHLDKYGSLDGFQRQVAFSRKMPLKAYLHVLERGGVPRWPENYTAPYCSFSLTGFELYREHSLCRTTVQHLNKTFGDWSTYLGKFGRVVFPGTVIYAHIGPAHTLTGWHYDFGYVHSWSWNPFGEKHIQLLSPTTATKLPRLQRWRVFDAEDESINGALAAAEDIEVYEGINPTGGLLFIPCGWWHQVRSRSLSLTVVCGFVNHTNILDHWKAVGVPFLTRKIIKRRSP